MDFIFTVCDSAAGETCPIWPGQPITAHWGVPDPATVIGSDDDKRKAFSRALSQMSARIDRLLALPVDKLDRAALMQRLRDIGQGLA